MGKGEEEEEEEGMSLRLWVNLKAQKGRQEKKKSRRKYNKQVGWRGWVGEKVKESSRRVDCIFLYFFVNL